MYTSSIMQFLTMRMWMRMESYCEIETKFKYNNNLKHIVYWEIFAWV